MELMIPTYDQIHDANVPPRENKMLSKEDFSRYPVKFVKPLDSIMCEHDEVYDEQTATMTSSLPKLWFLSPILNLHWRFVPLNVKALSALSTVFKEKPIWFFRITYYTFSNSNE